MKKAVRTWVLTFIALCLAASLTGCKDRTPGQKTEEPQATSTRAPETDMTPSEAPATQSPVTEAPVTEVPTTETAPGYETPGEYRDFSCSGLVLSVPEFFEVTEENNEQTILMAVPTDGSNIVIQAPTNIALSMYTSKLLQRTLIKSLGELKEYSYAEGVVNGLRYICVGAKFIKEDVSMKQTLYVVELDAQTVIVTMTDVEDHYKEVFETVGKSIHRAPKGN